MKKLLFVMLLLWGGGGLGLWYYNETQAQRFSFRTLEVTRGNLLATINATGTIEPQDIVDVGAQIAGEIQSFGPDPRDPSKPITYGSPVEEGTVLARITDSVFKARIDQMKASLGHADAELQSAQAKLKQTSREFDRSLTLFRQNRVPAAEHDTAIANLATSEANLALAKSGVELAQANLEEAKVNLGYTTIKSPVKGVILDRRVNLGQTVVSNSSAPSLFLIAKDLSRMEIWASVNETDIGAIHTGQVVQFNVASFPKDTFRGTVAQVRLNASMTQSVVTYTVVVDVDNSAGKLLPYLTARLQFEVEGRDGVLLVPNAALRWKPKLTQVAPNYREEFAKAHRSRAGESPGAGRSPSDAPNRGATLWVKAGEFVRPVETKVGLSDGLKTEIAAGGELIQGTPIVVGQVLADEAGEATSATTGSPKSPFLPDLDRKKTKK